MLKIIISILLSLGVSSALAVELAPKIQAWWVQHEAGDQGNDRDRRHHDPVTAPEIDPAGTLSGLTLLVGGLAVLRGRRLTKK